MTKQNPAVEGASHRSASPPRPGRVLHPEDWQRVTKPEQDKLLAAPALPVLRSPSPELSPRSYDVQARRAEELTEWGQGKFSRWEAQRVRMEGQTEARDRCSDTQDRGRR